MALQTSAGTLPSRMELMDGVFGDLSLAYGWSLWRFISKCWEKFSPHFSFEVGDGTTISF